MRHSALKVVSDRCWGAVLDFPRGSLTTVSLLLKFFFSLQLFTWWFFSLSVENDPHNGSTQSPPRSPWLCMRAHALISHSRWYCRKAKLRWQVHRLCSLEAAGTASSLITAWWMWGMLSHYFFLTAVVKVQAVAALCLTLDKIVANTHSLCYSFHSIIPRCRLAVTYWRWPEKETSTDRSVLLMQLDYTENSTKTPNQVHSQGVCR